MICGGDEIGRTQQGNNNAYCQDNEISWYNWNLDERKRAFLEFTRRLIAFRKRHPILGRPAFFQGRRSAAPHPGHGLVPARWRGDVRRGMGGRLGPGGRHAARRQGPRELTPRATAWLDDDLFLLLNGHYEPVTFCLPRQEVRRDAWRVVVDTASGEIDNDARVNHRLHRFRAAGEVIAVAAKVIFTEQAWGV